MEAYNFTARASIKTVHAEREGKVTSVASAKTMAKSVFSIATNITSGSEEEETDNNEVMDGAPGVKIDGMEMVNKEVHSLTNNMNRATTGQRQKRVVKEMPPATVTIQVTIQKMTPMTPHTSMTLTQKITMRHSRYHQASSM